VTGVLGGDATGALNALAPARVSGGGRRPCARCSLTRSSSFPYSTVVGARALLDSLDAISVFDAGVVDDYTRDCVERRVGDLDFRTDDLVMYISWDTPY
jgi:hypothetical protein